MQTLVGFAAIWLSWMVSSATGSSYFVFDLPDDQEDCYVEDVVSRSVHSDIFLHFEILEPEVYDSLDVRLISPSGREVRSWQNIKHNHSDISVRESGLYSLCFNKTASSSRRLSILYAFDFASVGTRTLTRYPASVATIQRDKPEETKYTELRLSTDSDGTVQSMGLVQFVFSGVSKSIIHDNTRIMMSFSVEYGSSHNELPATLSPVAGGLKHPSTWTAMADHLSKFRDNVIHGIGGTTGGTLFFDITDDVTAALQANEYPTLTYSIQLESEGYARLSGNDQKFMSHFPTITFEDMGLIVMREIAQFRYAVWDLKGELISIIHNERHSRNTAEAVQSRLVFSSIVTNVVLIALAIGQIVYVRRLIGTGYSF
ncbi:hypothetical protein LEN26_002249 [Aphanomyces euteiches]|nr:hypothetical protein AeMF1_013873 [Aphanomyces euteiches]KAH9159619.1 hypothetical protein LEN26_002249 [Aphanomyces euteiches]KAH9183888.1 hypothetical protein AeNC1_014137 [Aphanomyces euteiches]